MSFHGEFVKNQRLLGLLCAISRRPTLESTKALHALTITMGSIPNQATFVDNNIVSRYSSMGELSIARKVFDRMPQRNAVSYNGMISAHCRLESVEEAWNLLSAMRSRGFQPTQFTFGAILSGHGLNLCQAVQLQGLLVKNGLLGSDEFVVGTALLGLYGRLGHLTEAIQIFHDMPRKSIVTWNLMLSLFGKNGFVEDCMFLFRELMSTGTSLSAYSITGVLSSFFDEQDLECGRQMHCVVIKIGFDYNILIVNSLINTYIQCAAVSSAEKVFEMAPSRDVISWNTIIGAVAKSCSPAKAIQLFNEMSMSGILPSQATFVSLISSCSNLMSSIIGESIHAKAIVYALASDVIVGTAVVNFYSKFDKLVEARSCFSDILEKNVSSWNALISGCSNSCSSTSVNLLIDMLRLEFRPNEFTFSAAIKSTVARETAQLHGLILKMGFKDDVYVSSSLASAYAKNGPESDAIAFLASCGLSSAAICNVVSGIHNRAGHYDETLRLQSFLEEPDVVSWNIVIAACAKKNYYGEVFDLFRRMRMAQIDPDKYTFVSLLSICPKLSNLPLVSSIHGLIIKLNSSCFDAFVYNLIIDAYGKCGNLRSAMRMFEETTSRNTITWTVLISSLGLNGYAREAMERFREMELMGFEIDGVALLAVLRSCRYGGLVREAMEVFGEMKKYGVEPEMEHYHCVVDLLCKSGEFGEAGKLMAKMPFLPNAIMWRSFVDSCSRNRTLNQPLALAGTS